jgi:hypothetical protein
MPGKRLIQKGLIRKGTLNYFTMQAGEFAVSLLLLRSLSGVEI